MNVHQKTGKKKNFHLHGIVPNFDAQKIEEREERREKREKRKHT